MTDKILNQIKQVGAHSWVKKHRRGKRKVKRRLKKYSTAYYCGRALISDYDFEFLIDALKLYNPADKYLVCPGWGYCVRWGVKHIYGKIGTLKYYFDYEKIKDIFKHEENLVIMPKFDGLNVVVYFKNGKMAKLATRGNGSVGKKINKNRLKQIFYVPEEWKKSSFAISGELILNKAISKEDNARDVAAMYLKKKRVDKKLAPYIKLMPFRLINMGFEQDYKKQLEQLKSICGFEVENQSFKKLPTKYELLQLYKSYKTKYPIDGLVVSNKNMNVQAAYKFKEGEN